MTKGASGYARYDAMMAYQIDKNLSFQLNVYNLGNKVYYTRVRSPHYANMGAGRSAGLRSSSQFMYRQEQRQSRLRLIWRSLAVTRGQSPGRRPDASGLLQDTWRVKRIAARKAQDFCHQKPIAYSACPQTFSPMSRN